MRRAFFRIDAPRAGEQIDHVILKHEREEMSRESEKKMKNGARRPGRAVPGDRRRAHCARPLAFMQLAR